MIVIVLRTVGVVDVDFYDLREYEAECDWYFTEGTEGV